MNKNNITHVISSFLIMVRPVNKRVTTHLKKHTEQFPKHNPSKIIFNFSGYDLLDSEKSLLIKGLNFSLAYKKLQ